MLDIASTIKTIQSAVWGVPVLILLFGVGLYLTFLLKGVQFRYLFQAFRLIGMKEKTSGAKGDISPFQSLMTSVASAVGTGSIVGVATAICAGGLGAVFWMWVMALISMAIKYSEALLAVKYRTVDKRGEMAGGPMYYIENGLGWKWMATAFAIFGAIAAIGTGNLVQVNSIAEAMNKVFDIDMVQTGIGLAIICSIVLFRGIKSIAYVSSMLVPLMALFYMLAGLVVIFNFRSELPNAIALILSSAFSGQAAVGGFLGSTVMMGVQIGVARSIFSSEAGMGISSIAAAAAKTASSGRQAMLSMTATLMSTAVICTITAIVIALSGVMGSVDDTGRLVNGASLVIEAFSTVMPVAGHYIVAFGLILFAFTTVISWAYYGEKCTEYLLGERFVVPYRVIYTLLIVPGAIFALETIWAFADTMNAFMVIPNMIALLALSQIIKKETKEFLTQEPKTAGGQLASKEAALETLVASES